MTVLGARRDRPELDQMLAYARKGDIIVVTRLDRLARSTRDLLDLVELLRERGIGLRAIEEAWVNIGADDRDPSRQLLLTFFAGIAEFERRLIVSRTGSGRAAARARDVRFGRPPKLDSAKLDAARRLIAGGPTVAQAAGVLGVHETTLYRAMGRAA